MWKHLYDQVHVCNECIVYFCHSHKLISAYRFVIVIIFVLYQVLLLLLTSLSYSLLTSSTSIMLCTHYCTQDKLTLISSFVDYCECRSVLKLSALQTTLQCSPGNTSFHEICYGTLASPCDCVTSEECQVICTDLLLVFTSTAV